MRFPVQRGIDLMPIAAALDQAGVAHRALGTDIDSNLHTYDLVGNPADLPDAAGPVVAAYAPPLPPPVPDFGSDSTTADQVADAVTNLRAYLALASPTNAQTITAFKLLIRVVLFVLRRMF